MRIPLAWFQLSRERVRLLVALAGISFADILMFMQLGFQDALFESNTKVHQTFLGDLILISSSSKALHSLKPFSRRRLYQSLGLQEVKSVAPLYTIAGAWKNPDTGNERIIGVFGLDPSQPTLNLPEVNQQLNQLKLANVILYDRASRPEFGPIATKIEEGKIIRTELNKHQVKVGGLITLGTSFAFDGTVLLSAESFVNIFSNREINNISLGLVRLEENADVEKVRQDLVRLLPKDIKILTHQEFIEFEKHYWATSTPIGFIFIAGTIMGFVVGMIIVYQILYTDISNHLPEYATLKAIGYTQKYLLGVVFQSAIILAVLGYIPGFALSWGLYHLTRDATQLPITMKTDRSAMVLVLTVAMCTLSGSLVVRRLQDADPADIF
ncbi:MAG: ABC transporter permease DevC [Crocosphaera sp.]|nr:ABC transporter permease DevC [Crocosphaera sp.]